MTIFLTVLHVMVCIVLIIVVLLQRGRGADIGAVFGGGASTTVFGSRGAGNFLTKLTTGAAMVFMATSLLLAYYARERSGSSIFEEDAPRAESPAPETGAPLLPEAGAGGFEEVGEPAPAAGAGSAPPADAPADAPAEADTTAPAAGGTSETPGGS